MFGKECVQARTRLSPERFVIRPFIQEDQAADLFFHVTRRVVFEPSFLDVLLDVRVDVPAHIRLALLIPSQLGVQKEPHVAHEGVVFRRVEVPY